MQRFSFRLPANLVQRLDECAVARGMADRSEALRAMILEASVEPEERRTVPDRAEILVLLADAARTGNVTAMKTLLEEHRRDGDDDTEQAGSFIDELRARREQRSS